MVTALWLVIGLLIHFWVLRSLRKELGHLFEMVTAFESALERDEVESFDGEAALRRVGP